MKLVEERNGFEFYQAYRDDVDHIIGGKGDTYWYLISKEGKTTEERIAKYKDGKWSDQLAKGRGAKKTTREMPAGSTIKLIAEKAYLMQNEDWVTRKKDPKVVSDSHPHYHFVYGFGDKGLDVSAEYGVTIAYSDIKDPSAGFHLRYLYTGNDVETP